MEWLLWRPVAEKLATLSEVQTWSLWELYQAHRVLNARSTIIGILVESATGGDG